MGFSLKEEGKLEMLKPDEFFLAKPFFVGFNIYASILHSILERRSPGKIFTDDKANPSFFLVCSPSEIANLNAPAYLGGHPNQVALRKIINHLKALSKVSLPVSLDWQHMTLFEEAGFKTVSRLQLRRPLIPFDLSTFTLPLTKRYSVERMNKESFAQCNWHSFILSLYGDNEHFLNNGAGFCIVDQRKIAAESYAFIANGHAEIGVITDKNYRGQNLGTIVSAIMIDYCYKHSIEPFWNCDVSNPASSAIAKKLGFEEQARYQYLKWMAP